MGVGAQAAGNLTGQGCQRRKYGNSHGHCRPKDVRDPYVYNYYLGIQRELMPKLVLEANYVGTTGHKLFRARIYNRIAGGRLPHGRCSPITWTKLVQHDGRIQSGGPLEP